MNSGTKLWIGTGPSSPISSAPQPSWNTAVNTP